MKDSDHSHPRTHWRDVQSDIQISRNFSTKPWRYNHLELSRDLNNENLKPLSLSLHNCKYHSVPTKTWKCNSMNFPWLSMIISAAKILAIFHKKSFLDNFRNYHICHYILNPIRVKFAIFQDYFHGWDSCKFFAQSHYWTI